MYWRIYGMRKKLLILLCVGILGLTGCQSEEEKQKQEAMEAFESMGVAHDEVVVSILSKKWNALGSEAVYEFTKDGNGNVSGTEFTYTCGFNEDNEILLQISMKDSKDVFHYFVSSDDTGHGLLLESADGEGVLHLIPEGVELLDISDERAAFFVGEWADKSDNRYIFDKDFTMKIKGSDSENEGTYSVVVRDGVPLITLVFGGNTLEFEYELLEDGQTVKLCMPGTDTVHTWIKK